MAIEFFRNDMMNKLFVPMVITGTIALTAGVISTTDWSPFSNPTSNIVTPNVDDENTDGENTDGGNTDGGNTDGGDTDGGNTDGGSTDGGNIGNYFDDKAADYEIMGGLDDGDMTDEQLGYITSGTTTVVRCTSDTNYFIELGFNDISEEWTYIISPVHTSKPVKLLSEYSFTNTPFGFRWHKETYDYINTSGQIDWLYVVEADTNFGDNNGTVEWSEWKEYMIETHIREFGYDDCDEFTYMATSSAQKSSLSVGSSNYNLSFGVNISNLYIEDFANAKVLDLSRKVRH